MRQSISTTSGFRSLTIGGALSPVETLATTWISSRIPNSSSSVSRKVSLSSTRTTRTGGRGLIPPPAGAGSAADRPRARRARARDAAPRAPRATRRAPAGPRRSASSARRAPAGRGGAPAAPLRQPAPRLGGHPPEHGADAVADRVPRRDRLAVGEAEPRPLVDGDAVQLEVTRRDRDRAGGDRLDGLGHRLRV